MYRGLDTKHICIIIINVKTFFRVGKFEIFSRGLGIFRGGGEG